MKHVHTPSKKAPIIFSGELRRGALMNSSAKMIVSYAIEEPAEHTIGGPLTYA